MNARAVAQMDVAQTPLPKRTSPNDRASTTSFLTATTLIYATGAGITAAAGTRLALQWIIEQDFTLISFQSRDKAPSCYFLSLPP